MIGRKLHRWSRLLFLFATGFHEELVCAKCKFARDSVNLEQCEVRDEDKGICWSCYQCPQFYFKLDFYNKLSYLFVSWRHIKWAETICSHSICLIMKMMSLHEQLVSKGIALCQATDSIRISCTCTEWQRAEAAETEARVRGSSILETVWVWDWGWLCSLARRSWRIFLLRWKSRSTEVF